MDFKRIDTKLIHSGEPKPRILGAVSMPIFQSATFEYHQEGSYHDIRYIRMSNTPNHIVLHQKLAALENAEAALVTTSGMAAISTSLMAFLSAGDHLLAQTCLYGGVHDFINTDLPRMGVTCDFIDGADPESWAGKVRPNTKVIYVETIANPLMEVSALDRVPDFARRHGLVSMVDNTFATPVNFRPAEWGFDLSLHSCTKYMNGHSDIVAGGCIGNSKAIETVKHKLDHLGGSLDPHAAFLLHRGLKTLALRVRYQNVSALKIARFFSGHPMVAKVYYPGLETHPQHEIAARLLNGFGGMLSIELKGGVSEAEAFMTSTTLPVIAPSLGGVETLLTRPATTSHAGLSPAERERVGIRDSLVRISVGIEDTDELIEDFTRALGCS